MGRFVGLFVATILAASVAGQAFAATWQYSYTTTLVATTDDPYGLDGALFGASFLLSSDTVPSISGPYNSGPSSYYFANFGFGNNQVQISNRPGGAPDIVGSTLAAFYQSDFLTAPNDRSEILIEGVVGGLNFGSLLFGPIGTFGELPFFNTTSAIGYLLAGPNRRTEYSFTDALLTTTVVPLPASLPLMGAALAATCFLAKRRRLNKT